MSLDSLPATVAPTPTPRAARWGDRRTRTLTSLVVAVLGVAAIVVAGTWASGPAAVTDLAARNQPPSLDHFFGTDRLGRDLFERTLVGLRLSLVVGSVAAAMSGAIALLLSLFATVGGRRATAIVNWLVDLFLALPHLVLLILLAFALGGGTQAVILAVGLTHWPRLTRVLMAKAAETASAEYVEISRALGRSRGHIARRHLTPHLIGHFSVGVILIFPHAILHEAALSFLGLGIDPGLPAIGILLSESMRSLSAGYWWLAVLPGLSLLLVVKLIDRIGEDLRLLTDPRSAQL